MSSSTSPHPATRSPPSLPTELISQILQSPRLSKSDLARCCLVNRQFLSLSRLSLYRSVVITFLEDRQENRQEDRWYLDETTRLLIRTLETNIPLSRKVSKLRFKGNWLSPKAAGLATRVKCGSFSKVTEGIFGMLPQVVFMQVDGWI